MYNFVLKLLHCSPVCSDRTNQHSRWMQQRVLKYFRNFTCSQFVAVYLVAFQTLHFHMITSSAWGVQHQVEWLFWYSLVNEEVQQVGIPDTNWWYFLMLYTWWYFGDLMAFRRSDDISEIWWSPIGYWYQLACTIMWMVLFIVMIVIVQKTDIYDKQDNVNT